MLQQPSERLATILTGACEWVDKRMQIEALIAQAHCAHCPGVSLARRFDAAL
jgi:hypothetical protein